MRMGNSLKKRKSHNNTNEMPIQPGHLIPSLKMSRMRTTTPPTLILFCLIGMLALHSILPLGSIFSWTLLVCGVGLIALGLVIAFGAESQFRRNGTTVDHLGMAAKLVTDGWFKYSRNPMYLSFVIMLTGAWLTLGSISPFLGVLVYILLIERWYIMPEEKRLVATFGKQYESYRIGTRRWL